MPARENQRAMGMRLGQAMVRSHGTEVRQLRLRSGLTQQEFSHASGVSTTYLGRLESGRQQHLDLPRLSAMYAVLGHRLSIRAFPVGRPVRDAGHLRLLDDFDARISHAWRRERESVMPIPGDLRAWDELLRGPVSIGVEAETVLGDLQAQVREMAAKQRDSRVTRMILLVRGSHRNRALVAEHIVTVRLTFPLDTRQTLHALSRGGDPSGNGVVIL